MWSGTAIFWKKFFAGIAILNVFGSKQCRNLEFQNHPPTYLKTVWKRCRRDFSVEPTEQFLICSNIGKNEEFIFKGRIQNTGQIAADLMS